MKHYQITCMMKQKDGRRRKERIVTASPDSHNALTVDELPAAPGPYQHWENGKLVTDEAGLADEVENARLQRMTRKERHEEAIERAKVDIMKQIGGPK